MWQLVWARRERLYRTSAVEASRYVVLHAEDGRVSRASLRTGTGVVKSQEYGLVCTPGLERRSPAIYF